MLSHTTQTKTESLTTHMARQLGANLVRRVIDRSLKAEAITVMTMPTLLDPRFKKLGFLRPTKLDEAVTRLKGNCSYNTPALYCVIDYRKKMVDEALVNMVIKDSQPFSVVEDVGFRELVHALDPSYVLPTRKHAVNMESISVMTMPTLLDPRLKKLGFLSSGKLQEAITRLKSECAKVIRNSETTPPAQLPASQALQSPACASRKKELDEALVDMVVKDCQPFSVVNDQGFRGKLLKEVETRWNSTYIMLERLYSEREAVSAAMASLHTEVTIIEECLGVLGPFNEATVELSEEKRVSASKILPLLKMVSLALAEQLGSKTTEMAKHLTKTIQLKLMESLSHYQKTSILTLPTVLDPRFKTLGFHTPSKADEAVKRLTTECAQVISHTPSPLLNASVHEDEVPSTSSGTVIGPERKPLRWRVAGRYPATLAPNVGPLRPGRDTEGLSKLHWSHQPRRGQPPQHQLPLNGSDGQRRSGEAAQRPPRQPSAASLPRIQPGAAQASRPSARGPGAQGPMLQEEMGGGSCLVALALRELPPRPCCRASSEPIQPAPATSYPRDTSASRSSSPRPPVSGTEGEGGVGV
ncbi:hypothetical protein N1851_019465 [Merluccius polli]|uniref:Uncharacterized protein n=1 Tax=Merluccius polli TaxID=89951 RepID=A0AA47MLK7_MERPO|nr:hypothetical protein N1851_019465 [Merluccius polli]